MAKQTHVKLYDQILVLSTKGIPERAHFCGNIVWFDKTMQINYFVFHELLVLYLFFCR